jgi:hypothetical protein
MKKQIHLMIGDIVSRRKRGLEPFIIHYGIVVGFTSSGQLILIENTKNYGVRQTTLDEFILDAIDFKIVSSTPIHRRNQMIQTAKSYLGHPYSLTSFNCEHFVNFVKEGKPYSKQIQSAGKIIGLALAVFIFTRNT